MDITDLVSVLPGVGPKRAEIYKNWGLLQLKTY